MPNIIEYAKLFGPKLDELFVQESTTGWMDNNADQIQYNGGDEYKVPIMTTQAPGDYDRVFGYVQGDVTHRYQTHKLAYDRGRRMMIDAMDVNESNFVMNAAAILRHYNSHEVVPEIDAVRYARISGKAISTNNYQDIAITKDNALDVLLDDIAAVSEKTAGKQLIITLSPTTLRLLSGDYSGKINGVFSSAVLTQGRANLTFRAINEQPIVVAAQERLNTQIDIYDGKSSGQSQGGWSRAGEPINWIITERQTPIGIIKHQPFDIIQPNVNATHDAYIMKHRLYHDLIILDNKVDGVFVSYNSGV